MKKTLLVDGQLFQGQTWDRGMGKYSLELLASLEIAGLYSDYDIRIILNSVEDLDIERKEVLVKRVPHAKLVYLDLHMSKGLEPWQISLEQNRKLIDQYIGNACKDSEVSYLILSLFEGEWISAFPTYAHKMLLFYDIIPYLFHEHYLENTNVRAFYLRKFQIIFEAETIYTISQTTLNDLVENLGIPLSKLVNIDGARISRGQLVAKKPSMQIGEKYILMPSGDDFRKNNNRAVQGFADFNKAHNGEYQLIITSFFSDRSRDRLSAIGRGVTFSGNVSEEELLWLYQNATAIFFAPEYEGLGLPVLEAIDVKKPIACSNITVFREMSSDAFSYFDPYDFHDISRALDVVVREKAAETMKEYGMIEKKYTWKNTAKKFTSSLCKVRQVSKNKNIKIAIVGPDPAGYSGIGKVMQLMHPIFSEYADIEYYIEKDHHGHTAAKPSYIESVAICHDVLDFTPLEYSRFDSVVYHLGNSDNHLITAKHALCLPGIAIIHDTSLQGLYGTLVKNGVISLARKQLEEAINIRLSLDGAPYSASIVNNQMTVVAHSLYALHAVEKAIVRKAEVRVVKLNLPIHTTETFYPTKKDNIQIGVAGIITTSKGVDFISNIAKSDFFRSCDFYVFGYSFAADRSLLKKLKNISNLRLETNLTDFTYEQHIRSLDILIAYRTDYNGEASYTTLEAMRQGVVAIVRNIGWFSELPDEVVYKVDSEEQVEQAILRLLKDGGLMDKISRAARTYVALNHSPEKYVIKLVEEISESVLKSDKTVEVKKIKADFDNYKKDLIVQK